MPILLAATGCGRAAPDSDVTARDSDARPSSSAQGEKGGAGGHPASHVADIDVSHCESLLQSEEDVGLPQPIGLLEHVFWEPDDSSTFRQLLISENLARDRTVLEIGTGSGLVSLCCLHGGATSAVATDINPWAFRNAILNAQRHGVAERLSVRLVPPEQPGAWTVIQDDERFDIIYSNPPWQPGKPTHVEDYAFYDPGFGLMASILDGAPQHLKPGGRLLLSYGCREAIIKLQQQAARRGYTSRLLDERDLKTLPNLFLPGMLIEIDVRPPEPAPDSGGRRSRSRAAAGKR